MSYMIMIGGLFEASLLLFWRVSHIRTNRQHNRQSCALQGEINRLRHALADLTMERHAWQDNPRRRRV